MTNARTCLLWCGILLFYRITVVSGFMSFAARIDVSRHTARSVVVVVGVIRAVEEEEDDDNVLRRYSEEWQKKGTPPKQEEEEEKKEQNAPWKTNARWNSLSPKVKLRILQDAQEKAIENKKKRESTQDKKRRMMMFFKTSQQQKKRASHVQREVAFHHRMPLSALQPGMQVSGKVISNTNFGSYVDIGTECDGLLHVSQMTRDFFVEHPRQLLQPGQNVTVFIKSTNPELKKLHLTMLLPMTTKDDDDNDNDEDCIPLEEISVDDELWGEITRVTAFGAYVELGAIVDGFLHFMDHPLFGATTTSPGAPPSDFMHVGDRIRVWVTNVDMDKSRIKLTANRPAHLPGPRRDIY